MNLDADRLAQLAGLPATNRRNLSEASNRSLHDDSSVSDEVDHRFGKGQLAEEQKYGGNAGDHSETHPGEEDYTTKKGEKLKHSGPGRGEKKGDEAFKNEGEYAHEAVLDFGTDEEMSESEHAAGTVEVDEAMLAEEIERMKRERIQENELRSIIRAEIGSIVKSLREESKNKRRPAKPRGITMGIPGPGFR